MKPEGFNVEIKHFTDLLRTFYLHAPPTSSKSKRCNCFNWITRKPASKSITSNERPPRKEVRKLLYSATQLHEAGVKFEFTSKCLLDLDFDKSNGVLKIPGLELNDSAEARIRSVMAYLNGFGKNPRNRWCAILEHEYFNAPWRGSFD